MIRPTRPLVALAFAALASLPTVPAGAIDYTLGASAESSYSFAVPGAACLDYASFEFEPLASASGSIAWGEGLAWELSGKARLSGGSAPAKAEAVLKALSGRMLWGPASLELGYGIDADPAAEVFPLGAFLGPADPLSRLESTGASSDRRGEVFGKVAFVLGDFRASFLCAPFRPALALPDLGSPWFPRNIVAFGGSSFALSAIYYEAFDDPEWYFEPSYLAELGAVLGPVDLGLRYFRGLERQASLHPRYFSAGSRSEIWLAPQRAIIEAATFSATAIAGPARLWFEAAGTKGASLSSGTVQLGAVPLYWDPEASDFTEYQPIVNRDRLAATMGASWSPSQSWASFTLFAEGTWSWYRAAPPSATVPALERALALGLNSSHFGGRVDAAVELLYSFVDRGWAALASAGCAMGAEGKMSVILPIFSGLQSSELGRYSDKKYLRFVYSFQF